MKTGTELIAALLVATLIGACSGGSNHGARGATQALPTATGTISISLTDGPWNDAMAMVLGITGIEMGHSDGTVVTVDLSTGPMDIDVMGLQNGMSQMLADAVEVPIGQYDWIRLKIDPDHTYFDMASTGGRHMMMMGNDATEGLEVHEPFEIRQSAYSEFMLDFDLRRGVQYHENGMMGGEYHLHSALRMIDMSNYGGLMGDVHSSLIDVNNPNCDDSPGGNWVYLFHGDVMEPDDIADPESDGMDGPIAADRVEMDDTSGLFHYHFGYLEPGRYRVAMTCSSEWDEAGDDDYPADPDGRFSFGLFSAPIDVLQGQMMRHDLVP